MNELAEHFASEGVGSVFLYTNEAHPGENYPHLTSMDVLAVTRPIVLDALDGAAHRAYGSMPNMTWIFNQAGVPVYKSDWTDHYSVRNALEYALEVLQRRRGRERLVPFRVERLDYRAGNPEAFFAGLARSGPKAVREFREAGL